MSEPEPMDAASDLYREVVMEHKRAPRNFGTLAAPTHHARGRNPQCGDDIEVPAIAWNSSPWGPVARSVDSGV